MPSGGSPDLGDALALTFAAPVSARFDTHNWLGSTHRSDREYDPYRDLDGQIERWRSNGEAL